MAEIGQVCTQISHLTHLSVILAILKILAGSIALTGHASTQVLHLTHLGATAMISSSALKSSSSNWKSSPSSSNSTDFKRTSRSKFFICLIKDTFILLPTN